MLKLFNHRQSLLKRQLQTITVLINLCNQHFPRPVYHTLRFCTSSSGDSGSTTDSANVTGQVSPFKQKLLEKHFLPAINDAPGLEKLFHHPKTLVDVLYEPFSRVEKSQCPELILTKSLNDQLYKAKLVLHWPCKTSVTGIHVNEDKSIENAYLQACELFQGMGLIRITGLEARVFTIEDMIKLLEKLAEKQQNIRDSSNYLLTHSLNQSQDEELYWSTRLQVMWPVCFTVMSNASCINLAYYQACMLAAMKFKGLGYLNSKNQLDHGILYSLDKYNIQLARFEQRNICNPDYEIFVDSSRIGMGAYLLTKDDDKIRWISDPWIKEKIGFDPTLYSNAAEFYALVTACYTWKHKFEGKKVLCYSDNKHAINLVNHGLFAIRNHKSKIFRPFYNLYMLLSDVCFENNITLVGLHVPRIDNIAADLLSRCDVTRFKQLVPTAHDSPKKSKKLWFCKTKIEEAKEDDKSPEDKDK